MKIRGIHICLWNYKTNAVIAKRTDLPDASRAFPHSPWEQSINNNILPITNEVETKANGNPPRISGKPATTQDPNL